MSTIYITGIIMKTGTNSSAETQSDIADYRISSTKQDGGNWFSKKVFFSDEYSSSNDYYSYNSTNQKSQKCEVKTSVNGEQFLQTLPDDTTEDNLLSLPRFKR